METLLPSKGKMRADVAALGAKLSRDIAGKIYFENLDTVFNAYKNRIYEALVNVYGTEAIVMESSHDGHTWGGFLIASVSFYQVTQVEIPGWLFFSPSHVKKKREIGNIIFERDLELDNFQKVQVHLLDPAFTSVTGQTLKELEGELREFYRSYKRGLEYMAVHHYRTD